MELEVKDVVKTPELALALSGDQARQLLFELAINARVLVRSSEKGVVSEFLIKDRLLQEEVNTLKN